MISLHKKNLYILEEMLATYGADQPLHLVNSVTMEKEAIARGFRIIMLDTAETASKLIEYYHRRGFREVGHHHWRGKTYRSVVMAKPLAASETT